MKPHGGILVAVEDATGAIINEDGIDPDKLTEYVATHGGVKGYADTKPIEHEAFFQTEADIFIPAALENQITQETAPLLNVRLIAEGANGPTTPGADKILDEKKVLVIPDILANAGGVTVSYLEWVQNLTREHWLKEVVEKRLEDKMMESFYDVFDTSKRSEVNMRTAALMLGVGRVAESLQTLGLWP